MGQLMEKIRILLLFEDHALFRASLARLLGSVPEFEITGESSTANGALETLAGSSVDVILLECDSEGQGDCEFMTAARQAGYRGRFLIVAASATPRLIASSLRLGTSGVFLQSEAPERLVQAIKLVANGETWIDPKIIQEMAEQLIERHGRSGRLASTRALEDRENTVLLGILEGLTNKKIGIGMGLSEASVKNIVQRLFGKAGVKTRAQLVRAALDGTWVSEQVVSGNAAKG
ncbi:MAG TPA: response regulator transcription factor [Verrucomicrobiae bacterium]|nr:response regulator transcription factor [Verrucomicrobiae bacterium]